MPRANRVILPGYTYHLTQRCHDGEFLLRFQRDHNTYRKWLRKGAGRNGVPVLGYCITSNHVHVVIHAEARDIEEVREAYCGMIEERAEGERFARDSRWSEPVAVGSERFVRAVAGRLGRRRRIDVSQVSEEGSTWHAREVSPRYS